MNRNPHYIQSSSSRSACKTANRSHKASSANISIILFARNRKSISYYSTRDAILPPGSVRCLVVGLRHTDNRHKPPFPSAHQPCRTLRPASKPYGFARDARNMESLVNDSFRLIPSPKVTRHKSSHRWPSQPVRRLVWTLHMIARRRDGMTRLVAIRSVCATLVGSLLEGSKPVTQRLQAREP